MKYILHCFATKLIHTSNVKPWPRAPSYFTKSTATSKQIVKSAELSTIHRYVFQVYRFQDIPRKKAAICPSLVSATTKRLWLRASSNVGTRRCFFHEVSIPKKKVLQTAGGYSITNLTNYIPSVSETLENWFWRVLLVKSCQILSEGTAPQYPLSRIGALKLLKHQTAEARDVQGNRIHQERLTL